MTTTASKLISKWAARRETEGPDEFIDALIEEPIFIAAVGRIFEANSVWGERVGIGKAQAMGEDLENSLSPVDRLLYRYFGDRVVPPEVARDRADFVLLITDIMKEFGTMPKEIEVVPHKFIVSKKRTSNPFSSMPKWGAVIPIGNSNSHDYPIGEVAIRTPFMPPKRFIISGNGSYGNNMTELTEELTLPDIEEFAEALARSAYYNSDVLISVFSDFA